MNTAQNLDAIPLDELDNQRTGLRVCALNLGAFLAENCGGSERASLEIRRAMDLPASVVRRAAKRAETTVNADGLPSISDLAAYLVRIMASVESINAAIERRQTGAALT